MSAGEVHIGKTTKVSGNPVCLVCGGPCGGATNIDSENDVEHSPKPGHVSICAHCCSFLIFCDDLSLREMNDEERIDFFEVNPSGYMAAIRVQRALQLINKQWPTK